MRHALADGGGGRRGCGVDAVAASDPWVLAGDDVDHCAAAVWVGHAAPECQRVGGTIAGGVLAALLAAAIPSEAGVIAVITVTSVLTLATYAVDYGWYCFFLTPTFVLMSLPHLQDWHFAGLRMGTTVVGAVVAVVAMRRAVAGARADGAG